MRRFAAPFIGLLLFLGIALFPITAAHAETCPAYPAHPDATCTSIAKKPDLSGLLYDDQRNQDNVTQLQIQLDHLQAQNDTQGVVIYLLLGGLILGGIVFGAVTLRRPTLQNEH